MTWGIHSYAVDWAEGDGEGKGLFIQGRPGISFWRHHGLDRRSIGRWEVYASTPEARHELLGDASGSPIRAAVVDDFGSLVFVGESQ